MSTPIYIIGRIRDGKFESYRGHVWYKRREARQYLEDALTPRHSPIDGWTVFEAHDVLSHIHQSNSSN